MLREVRVFFVNIGNLRLSYLIAQVRHLADQFGRPGIVGKRGQTNRRVRQQGYLSIILPSKRMAIAYQDAVEQFWGDRVETKRYRLS